MGLVLGSEYFTSVDGGGIGNAGPNVPSDRCGSKVAVERPIAFRRKFGDGVKKAEQMEPVIFCCLDPPRTDTLDGDEGQGVSLFKTLPSKRPFSWP